MKKILAFLMLSVTSKTFRKIILKPLSFRKDLKFAKDNQTDKNFMVPLRMHFLRSKSILDSLKSVFNVFRRRPLLITPVVSAPFPLPHMAGIQS